MADKLKCSERNLLRAVLSPNARGYVLGALSEIILQKQLKNQGFECRRIVEKPPGGFREKTVYGDLYVRRRGARTWWVLECKGLKSNAEKHLYLDGLSRDAACTYLAARAFPAPGHNREKYLRLRRAHSDARVRFRADHPGKNFARLRQNPKSPGSESSDLRGLWSNQAALRRFVQCRPGNALRPALLHRGHGLFSILQTHKPSRRTDPRTGITQAAPLRTDFDVLAIDLFLRTGRHEFVFASTARLNTSPTAPNHLYQNYTIDILVPGLKDRPSVRIPWRRSFFECVTRDRPRGRALDESQLDRRTASIAGFLAPVVDT